MAAFAAPADIDIQITIEAGNWPDEAVLSALAQRVVAAATRFLVDETGQKMPAEPPELSLLFTDDAAMRTINAAWRAKDKPTNVLSFPATPLNSDAMPGPMLGDIVLAFETVSSEAKDLERNFEDHLAHLLVHGYLHLFGYDHIDAEEADLMESSETRILAILGVSDPYGTSDPA